MDITYGYTITTADYTNLRKSAGWSTFSEKQAQAGINNSTYLVAAYDDVLTVGTARVIYDGGYIAFIADVIVLPEYQKQGIGKTMMDMIMSFLNNSLEAGEVCYVCLMAAHGKEGFYQRLGFEDRPNEHLGAGMTKWIKKDKITL